MESEMRTAQPLINIIKSLKVFDDTNCIINWKEFCMSELFIEICSLLRSGPFSVLDVRL